MDGSVKDSLKRLDEVIIPRLSEIEDGAREHLLKAAVYQRLVRKTDFELQIAGITISEEIRVFLSTKKQSTRGVYLNALKELAKYAGGIKKRLLEFTCRDADGYSGYLKSKGYSNASICLRIAVASGFCGFLERRHFGGFTDGWGCSFRNPFRGTATRPDPFPQRSVVIPGKEEVEVMLEMLPSWLKPAVAIMALQGLRCDALSTLTITGNLFSCISKGKQVKGTLVPEVQGWLHPAHLERYKRVSSGSLKHSVCYHTGKLLKRGLIKAMYSCHDFRHYFAVTEYRKDRDIWRVSRLLGHTRLSVTDHYLRTLGQCTDT
jgi:integrase